MVVEQPMGLSLPSSLAGRIILEGGCFVVRRQALPKSWDFSCALWDVVGQSYPQNSASEHGITSNLIHFWNRLLDDDRVLFWQVLGGKQSCLQHVTGF